MKQFYSVAFFFLIDLLVPEMYKCVWSFEQVFSNFFLSLKTMTHASQQ